MGHPLPTLGRPHGQRTVDQALYRPARIILWLPTPEACPSEALGFDFDGARFSHVGDRVTFETIRPASPWRRRARPSGRCCALLDIGGTQPAEAAGVERVLAGLRASPESDDELLDAACAIFDGLLAAFAVKRRPMNDNSMQPDSAKPRSSP